MRGLHRLNMLPGSRLEEALERCCGSQNWVSQMSARRPFARVEELHAAAEEIWWSLSEGDWLEAFSCHPRIGDIEGLRKKYGSTRAWSEEEQGGVHGVDEAILAALDRGNREYEEKFGFTFLVCATGKSAAQMLDLLRGRLPNERRAELRIAAEEHTKITRIRLEKLLAANEGEFR